MYNQATDNWVRKADFPEVFTNHATSFVFNDEIFVMHGFGVTWLSKSIYKYNPVSNQWIKLKDFPGYARTGATGSLSGEKFYCGSGFASWNEKDWWEYNPTNDQWKKLKAMPDKGRINANSFSLNNRIFVTSGRYLRGEHNGGHLKNDILEYDINKNIWYLSGEIPGARENALSFIINGKAYIAFGEGDLAIIRDDIWCIETN
jgi:N-acetylneuraminic acid mutarotase